MGGGLYINGAMLMFDAGPTGNSVMAGPAGPGGLGGAAAMFSHGGDGGSGGPGGNGGGGGKGGIDGPNGARGVDGSPGDTGSSGQAGGNGQAGIAGVSSDPDIFLGGGGGARPSGPHRISHPGPSAGFVMVCSAEPAYHLDRRPPTEPS
jgi:hypothetical protein